MAKSTSTQKRTTSRKSVTKIKSSTKKLSTEISKSAKKEKSNLSGDKTQKKRDMYLYPALKKNLNLKSRQEEMHCDYLNKLSAEEMLWLNKFNKEYINASLDVNDLNKNLHNTTELKKDCQDKNNDRNRCMYSRAKRGGNLKYTEDLIKHPVFEQYEDLLNAQLDKLDIDGIKERIRLRLELKNKSNNSK